MIAFIANILFPVLAAAPLAAALALDGLQEDSRPWKRRFFFVSAGFLAWQLALTGFAWGSDSWNYLVRIVDPAFLFLFLRWSLEEDASATGDSHSEFLQHWRKKLVPVLALCVVLQVFAYLFRPSYQFFSAALAVLVALQMDRFYTRWSVRPGVSQRILLLTWAVSAALPLGFFRIFFLVQLAWIARAIVAAAGSRLQEQLASVHREQRIITDLMARLTANIRDVSDLRQSLSQFLDGLLEAVDGKAGAVYLWDAQASCFRCEGVRGYYYPLGRGVENIFARIQALHETAMSQPIQDQESAIWLCGFRKEELFLPYAGNDHRFASPDGKPASIQSLILEPLLLDQELLGVLVLQNKSYDRYFTQSDALVARSFSNHATMMINGSRALQERTEKERVRHELQLGYRIQADLLPRSIPQYPGIELAGSMTPAKEIGGDYYDFIHVDDDRLSIAIGDVSGKGVPAGMIMSILQTLLHAQYHHYANTKDLLVSINSALSIKIKASMFITLLLFEWNSKDRSLKYTACGHEHILHYRAAERRLDCLKSGGLALGMTEDNSGFIRERNLPVALGDTVVLYTDGIIEARNPEGEMYGLPRLRQFVERSEGQSAEAIRTGLLQNLTDFRKGAEQVDDITCLVMRF